MFALFVVGLVFASIAALLHVYIFVMESVRWTNPATWKLFGLKSQEEAQITRPLALNQGFYNLFLAVGAAIGVILLATGPGAAGFALVCLALGSMLAAALVLIISNPKLARSAIIQGTTPLIALVCLVIVVAAAGELNSTICLS